MMIETAIPNLPCMCANLRRTARVVTQFYNDALRPTGLSTSQLTILQVLSRAGELSQGSLGDFLAMDSTTLTRTLAIMRRQGWLLERRGDDRRQRLLRLSTSGETKLQRALSLWRDAQRTLETMVGEEAWQQLFQLADRVTRVVAK